MKLTPLERYAVYIVMLDSLSLVNGMCFTFSKHFGVINQDAAEYTDYYPTGYSRVLSLLSELKKREPVHEGNSYWFPLGKEGYQSRKKLLQECIREMEQKLFK